MRWELAVPLHQGVPVMEQSPLSWGCTEPLQQGSRCTSAKRNTCGMQADNREPGTERTGFIMSFLGCSELLAPPGVPLGMPEGGRAPSSPWNSMGSGPSSPRPWAPLPTSALSPRCCWLMTALLGEYWQTLKSLCLPQFSDSLKDLKQSYVMMQPISAASD